MNNTKVTDAIQEMNKLMDQLAIWGAGDSEPRWHFDAVMRAADEGQPFPINMTRDNPWELYESVSGWKMANTQLTKAAKKVYNAILRSKMV